MNIKSIALASVIAFGSTTALAADQTIVLTDLGGGSFSGSFAAQAQADGSLIGASPAVANGDLLFSWGQDVITFTGATIGQLYEVELAGNANFILGLGGFLNGSALSVGNINASGTSQFFGSFVATLPDFVLALNGSYTNPAAQYSGNISVTAIPEPETYALLLAGLAAMTFVARRRRPT